MKKSKLFKTTSFSSLALLMGAAGVFAFAPLGASAPLATANESEKTTYTTEQGLITPKADDPVIYTTESGLDIKYGNLSLNTSLGSGNLSGFPYFTTTSGSTTYTWVIIGRNSDTTVFGNAMTSYLFSTWKSTHNTKYGSMFNSDGSYFFNNSYENTTPAGSAINNIITSKSYVIDYASNSKVKTNSEIPSGCVLLLSNNTVGTCAFNSDSYDTTHGSGTYHDHNSTYDHTLKKTIDAYYTNDTFGFGSLKSSIQSRSLTTIGGCYNSSANATGGSKTITSSHYIFTLAVAGRSENYIWSNYLTAAQAKLSSNWWLRSGSTTYTYSNYHDYYHGYYINTSGAEATLIGTSTAGIRPAMVFKL